MACVQYTAGTTGGTQPPSQPSSGTGTLLLLIGIGALAMMLMGGKK